MDVFLQNRYTAAAMILPHGAAPHEPAGDRIGGEWGEVGVDD